MQRPAHSFTCKWREASPYPQRAPPSQFTGIPAFTYMNRFCRCVGADRGAARAGQTRSISVGLNSKRYPETVEVDLYKSVPGGFVPVGSLTQFVPVRPSNRTTDFGFSYTFTGADAAVGKVTFMAVATIVGARDALPADNQALSSPIKVNR
jgi:hypothetical protein